MSEDYSWINRSYGLTLKRGSRIEYTGDPKKGPQQGAVASSDGQYINVRFDGASNIAGPFHPTWEMRQIEDQP